MDLLCSELCLCYVRDFVCAMCGLLSVLCAGCSLCLFAGFRLCYVRKFVCVMCGISFVSCAGFSQCYVRDLVSVMFSP